jgi:hypothetical protein
LPKLLEALPLTADFTATEDDLLSFLNSLSLEDGLIVVRDALEEDNIRQMDNDNWNYFGDFVKHWRGNIIRYLEQGGIKYDEANRTFYTSKNKPIVIGGSVSKPEFISSTFDDVFYNELKREINSSYRCRLFTATFVLSRKMIENLVIDVLRLKFPQNIGDNLTLYYRAKDGRFHDFTVLLKNLEEKIDDFGVDKCIIEEFMPLVKVFRPQSNSKAHSIIIVGEEKDLIDAKVERMVELLLKLKQNLINELRKT